MKQMVQPKINIPPMMLSPLIENEDEPGFRIKIIIFDRAMRMLVERSIFHCEFCNLKFDQ